MPIVKINNKEQEVPAGATIIQACEMADVEVPRFCYHERLAIAGNCRMCLVEVAGGPPKPVASCAMPVADGMEVFTDTPMVKKAREGVMEFLLANHPLDCPICDQGGECDLQDQAYEYGRGESEFTEHKRSVKDKNMGPLIKTHMTRCIHCTRCVRFIEDVAGTVELGAVNRGEGMEITTYVEKNISSELSGNIIDLCPVGALTSKPYAFKARSWELKKTETIDVMDAVGSNIRIDSRGLETMRILPRLNEEINEEWISDKARFCYDGLKYQRLDKAYIKNKDKFETASIDKAIAAAASKIESSKKGEIGSLTGSLSASEEIFALKTLLDSLKVENYDCRLKGEKLDAGDKASYIFNSSIAGIEDADACLIIGANPRKDAPILNARIRKRFLSNELKIATIGCDADLTYKYDNLGNDVKGLDKILSGKSDFSKILKDAKKPMIILGSDVVSREDGAIILEKAKEIADQFDLIQKDWSGFNFLAKSSGLINGLEVGFVGKSNIEEIMTKCENGEIKTLILHSVDDDIDFDRLKETFVIYIGSHGDRGAHIADIILPGAAYSEKDALWVNLEGRVQQSKNAGFAPGEAKEDYELILSLAKALKLDLGFANKSELRAKLSASNEIFSKIDEALPRDWQKAQKVKGKLNSEEISYKDFDFYLTNPIARASLTMNKCSAENC